MVPIDKIPINLFQEDPTNETYTLGTVEISKGEYANAEKINQIIDYLNKLEERLTQQENR